MISNVTENLDSVSIKTQVLEANEKATQFQQDIYKTQEMFLIECSKDALQDINLMNKMLGNEKTKSWTQGYLRILQERIGAKDFNH